jgi:Serine/threonine protein phosphatase
MTDGNFEIVTAAVTDRGLSEKRPQNEDSYLSLPDHGVYAVADGVGGAMAGDVASQMAVEILGEAFINYSATADPEEIMTVAIDRANTAINQMASELPQLASMATTVVALHVSGNVATIAHVGDSRAYRLDPDGHLFRETQDHSVVEEEVRAGRMTPEQAANHPSRNVISRAVGAETTVDVDIKTIILEPGTTFLLCSDGITRHIPDQEIAELLTTGMSVADLCERMKDICYSRGAEDNLTAVIVKVTDVHRSNMVSGVPSEADLEEETVATARSPFEEFAESTVEQPSSVTEAVPAFTDDTVPQIDDEAYLIEQDPGPLGTDLLDAEVETGEYESSRLIVPAAVPDKSTDREQSVPSSSDSPAADLTREQKPVGVGSNIFRSLAYLLLGALIGAAGVYYWWQSRPEPAPVVSVNNLEPKSSNVPSNAFEESREIVDRDPDAYVQSNVASTKNAEDHYFLGRALFLSGKHFEAKRQFTLADERMADTDPKKAVTIRADMAMMSAIIEDGQAAEAFKRNFEIIRQRNVGTANVSNTNTNTNTAVSNANVAR